MERQSFVRLFICLVCVVSIYSITSCKYKIFRYPFPLLAFPLLALGNKTSNLVGNAFPTTSVTLGWGEKVRTSEFCTLVYLLLFLFMFSIISFHIVSLVVLWLIQRVYFAIRLCECLLSKAILRTFFIRDAIIDFGGFTLPVLLFVISFANNSMTLSENDPLGILSISLPSIAATPEPIFSRSELLKSPCKVNR